MPAAIFDVIQLACPRGEGHGHTLIANIEDGENSQGFSQPQFPSLKSSFFSKPVCVEIRRKAFDVTVGRTVAAPVLLR